MNSLNNTRLQTTNIDTARSDAICGRFDSHTLEIITNPLTGRVSRKEDRAVAQLGLVCGFGCGVRAAVARRGPDDDAIVNVPAASGRQR
jgi:hypothetical protein